MLKFIIKRIIITIPVIFIIIFLTFFLMKIAPGGPFDSEKKIPKEIEHALNEKYGLDKPFTIQFFNYLKNLTHLDLGPSFRYKDLNVSDILKSGIKVSFPLGLTALFIAVFGGISSGIVMGINQGKLIDSILSTILIFFICIPMFGMALIFVIIFCFKLKLLPVAGWGGIKYIILPSIVLSLPYFTYIANLTRTGMINTLKNEYVKTALMKGLDYKKVIFKHCLLPALIPVISYLGPAAAGILTGSIVIEKIFAIPGIGLHFINGAINRDYTLVLGVVLLYSTLLIIFNMLVDISYRIIDKRI